MHPSLAAIYHNNRTISLTGLWGSNVGWDMPIEKENLCISDDVHVATPDSIEKYVHQLNFCGPVSRGVQRVLLANRTRKPHAMKKIDNDVKAVVQHLSSLLGSTFAQARLPRAQKDSVLINPSRTKGPWLSVEAACANDNFSEWVKSHLRSKVTWM